MPLAHYKYDMPVINQSRRTWVVSKVKKADRLLGRIIGWIGRARIDPEAALWVKPCFGIHTFGMNFPVDLLYLEKDNRVVGLVSNLPINRVSPIYLRAWSVLVLPAYSIEKSQTKNGDVIEIS